LSERAEAPERLAAADIGGTFTDLISSDGRVAKVLTRRASPVSSVKEGLDRIYGKVPIDILAHGTTIATNALLERKGARTALVTNDGFADVIEIGRQTRPDLYDQFANRPTPLVPRDLRFEIECRIGPKGEVLQPLDAKSLGALCQALEAVREDIESVAVSLLHSYVNPDHELQIGRALRQAGFDVTLSCELSPEFREYERTSTVVANAYLRPVLKKYLAELSQLARSAFVMTSAGGLVPADEAAEIAAGLLLSGPVGGAIAASAAAAACGYDLAVTLDMGGTSTDVCMVQRGIPEPTSQILVGGFPIRLPSIEIHTIGAGGGSVAYIDPGGALQVGPESAGADPGPACYGRGGELPTVTDANLLAGRIPEELAFADLGTLDSSAAHEAMSRAGLDPFDVIAVVNANMERALRKVTAERGYDPSRLALVAFGGAGPLHACDLAEALGIPVVIVPPHAGVLSAVGLLLAPIKRELVKSRPNPEDLSGLEEDIASLRSEAAAIIEGWGFEVAETAGGIDCRYRGQSYELTAPTISDFHEIHRVRNGYSRPELPVEATAVRAKAWADPPSGYANLVGAIEREGRVVGPECIAEEDCTIFVQKGWTAEVHPSSAWIIRKTQ
jgi:N-methylhydantoinase A/oxoprolinase/acetone carboxylase beta subunit